MSFNRSKKMLELALLQNLSPQPATQTYESVPSTEVKCPTEASTSASVSATFSLQQNLGPQPNAHENFEILESVSVSNENQIHNTTLVLDCTDERQSSSKSDVDLSDQDATYKVPPKKRRPVCPIRSKHTSSFSSCSSSSSSGSSSDTSDTDSIDEQNKKQESIIQVTEEKELEQPNMDEPAATEVSLNKEFGEQEEKKKGRKRKRNQESWKQNVAKTQRNAGKSYITKRNEVIKPRSVQPPCGDKCRLKCTENINAGQRQAMFDAYWKLERL